MISPADWVRKAKDQVRLNEGEGYLFLIVRKRKSILVRFVPLVIDHNPGYKSQPG